MCDTLQLTFALPSRALVLEVFVQIGKKNNENLEEISTSRVDFRFFLMLYSFVSRDNISISSIIFLLSSEGGDEQEQCTVQQVAFKVTSAIIATQKREENIQLKIK
jgi:hypothetical protein